MPLASDTELTAEPLRDTMFRDAAVGVCALVSTSGAADPTRRSRVADRIGAAGALNGFAAPELRTLFEDNWHRLTLDPAFGRAYVLQQVARVTERPAQARAAVRVGLEITAAEGGFDLREAAVLRECCRVLRLAPAEFGL
ncbi:tellurite resistance protein [Nocardia transvalensis]|uniref:Tellurite resistance protein n=1 Tax=Nocardia transvalensis TaxID=37333 RepID=A0A7W9PL36_9NOCA|nr:TerB family tellurite resistance protein [Nocardia transvalensis]MBB5917875.1 tellurite resistance protein [Nocardia transvalensis]